MQILDILSNSSNSSLFQILKVLFSKERTRRLNQEVIISKLVEKNNNQEQEIKRLREELEYCKSEMNSLYIDREKEKDDQMRIEEIYRRVMNESQHQTGVEDLLKKFYDLACSQQEYERIGKWKSIIGPDFEKNIFKAAEDGKLSSIIFLLANGYCVNSKDKDNSNQTALHKAAQNGFLIIVEYLVNHKADINAKTDKF